MVIAEGSRQQPAGSRAARSGWSWRLRRLAAMSTLELTHRARQSAIIAAERRGLLTLPHSLDATLAAEGWAAFRADAGARFFFRAADCAVLARDLRAAFPQEWTATRAAAESLLRRHIDLFGEARDLGDPVAWQRDPLTGRAWPDRFWADIDTRDGQTVGGVKWVWELNRHHHLVTLGKAYFLSGEERFAEEVCAQLASWIEQNPPGRGVNWTSALEHAVRLLNWTWALAFVRDARSLTPDLFAAAQRSIMQQAEHIARHLSAYSSANNHLIGEAAGLATAGLAFPWLPGAAQWRERGLAILAREVERQISPDGVSREQSTSYLKFVLDLNLLTWELARRNGGAVPAVWSARFEAAADYLSHVMDEQGNAPAIGDGDDAWAVRLDDRNDANNVRSLLASAAALTGRDVLKARAGRWDEKSEWILGAERASAFAALPTSTVPPASRIFGSGGYVAFRDMGVAAVFDCGPLGYLSTAAHGHADALSLTLSLDGRPILVDPGTYAYQEAGPWRAYFRHTAAHNTVVVDGACQSEMQGTFLWGHKARARLLAAALSQDHDWAQAEHDGYAGRGIIHRRAVWFEKPGRFLIVDDLTGEGEHRAERLWHFVPGAQLSLTERGAEVRVEGYLAATVRWNDVEPTSIDLRNRRAVAAFIEEGWVSPRYGQRIPAPVLRLSAAARLPLRLVTIVSAPEWSDDDRWAEAALARLSQSQPQGGKGSSTMDVNRV